MADFTSIAAGRPKASISTRIWGPDPTTFEAYRSTPLVDPTKFWEGVGDIRILK